MPTTKKEGLVFGVMMCFGMVIVMSTYNVMLNGGFSHLPIKHVMVEMVMGFCVALILDLLVVGPLARKLTTTLPFNQSNKLAKILCMSSMMVLGMVFFMSIFGLTMMVLAQGVNGGNIFKLYGSIYLSNFIVAFPLQFLIMGPLVRYLFTKLIKNQVVYS